MPQLPGQGASLELIFSWFGSWSGDHFQLVWEPVRRWLPATQYFNVIDSTTAAALYPIHEP